MVDVAGFHLPLQQRDCEKLLLALKGEPLHGIPMGLLQRGWLTEDGTLTPDGLQIARTVQYYAGIMHVNGISIFDRTVGHTFQLQDAVWRSGTICKVPVVLTDSLILQASKAPVWVSGEPLDRPDERRLERDVKRFYKPRKWWPLRPSAYQIAGGLPGALQTIVFRIRKAGSPGKQLRIVRVRSAIYDLLVEQAQAAELTWWMHPNFDRPVIAVKAQDGELDGFIAFVRPLKCEGWPNPETGKL